jgi:hypothetical protein
MASGMRTVDTLETGEREDVRVRVPGADHLGLLQVGVTQVCACDDTHM